MKTKIFLSLFVIFTFTAATSVTAQKTAGYLSCNFQEVVNPNPYLMTVPELLTLRKQGIVPAGVTVLHTGITREMVDQPAVQDAVANNLNKEFKRQLVAINTKTEIFAPAGKFDADAFKKHIVNIEASIKIGTFDFHGQPGKMTSNQWQGNNLVAGSVMVEHDAIRTLECAYYDFGQFGIFPFQVLSCGNMLEDKLMFAVVSNTAHLVSNASAQNHGPDNKGFDNARNGGGAAGVGGSLTFEQILTLVEAMRQPVVVNAGNNVGNNNGGQGGQGGLVTSQGGPVSPSVPRATPGYTDPEGNVWTPMPKVDLNRTETVPLDRRGADQYSQTTTACGGCNQGALTRADVALLEQQGQVSNDLSLRSLRQQRAQTGLQAGGLVLGAGAFIVGQLEKFGVIKTPFRNGNGGTWNTPGGGPSDMPNGLWQ